METAVITPRLLTVTEYATYFNFSPRYVYNQISTGREDQLPVKPLRIGTGPKAAVRFDKVALDKWISDQS